MDVDSISPYPWLPCCADALRDTCGLDWILVLSLSHDLLVWLVALPAQQPLVLWCCLRDCFLCIGVVSAFWIGVVLVGGA